MFAMLLVAATLTPFGGGTALARISPSTYPPDQVGRSDAGVCETGSGQSNTVIPGDCRLAGEAAASTPGCQQGEVRDHNGACVREPPNACPPGQVHDQDGYCLRLVPRSQGSGPGWPHPPVGPLPPGIGPNRSGRGTINPATIDSLNASI
jgi:hypothetical protein